MFDNMPTYREVEKNYETFKPKKVHKPLRPILNFQIGVYWSQPSPSSDLAVIATMVPSSITKSDTVSDQVIYPLTESVTSTVVSKNPVL